MYNLTSEANLSFSGKHKVLHKGVMGRDVNTYHSNNVNLTQTAAKKVITQP